MTAAQDRLAEIQARLDPKPYVAWGVRYERQRGTAYFDPRPEFSQRAEDYEHLPALIAALRAVIDLSTYDVELGDEFARGVRLQADTVLEAIEKHLGGAA